MNDTLPPHSVEAERAVLCSLLLERDAVAEVAGWLAPDAFFVGVHATVYRAMLALWTARRPCDLPILTAFLAQKGRLDEVGGAAFLASLLDSETTAVHARHYAELVATAARRREVIAAASDMVAAAWRGDVAEDDLVGLVRRAVGRFAPPSDAVDPSFAGRVPTLRETVVSRWDGTLRESVVSTGFRGIDRRMMGGLRPGEMAYVGGRPGSGKTSLALQVASAAARAGTRVLFVELEMAADALLARAVAGEAGVPFSTAYDRLGDVASRNAWLEASDRVETLPVAVETALATTDRIAAWIDREAAEDPVGLVVIDHLDYLADPDLARLPVEQRTAETSKRLRRIANGAGVPILVLAQLNRAVEEHPPFKPALTHFRYSGAIEQDADYAFLLYRRRYYVEKGLLTEDIDADWVPASSQHRVELLLAKSRNGEVGMIDLGWIPDQMTFTDRSVA